MLIGYTRVSPEHQDRERESCALQEQRIRSYCDAHGYELGEVIRDEDVSGKSLERPGWRRVAELLESGQAAGVVVYKLDRLTRSLRDLLDLMDGLFRRHELHAVADRLDTTTATGRLIIHILGSISQWERETIGERTRAALQYKKSRGAILGGAPYGWRKVTGADGKLTALEPVPEEQEVVRQIRDQASTGIWTQDELAQRLNAAGYRTRPLKKGAAPGRWSRRGVQCVLAQAELP